MSGRTLLVASNRNPGLCEQTQKKKELVHITEPFQGRFLTLSISLFSSVAIHPREVSPAQDGGGGGWWPMAPNLFSKSSRIESHWLELGHMATCKPSTLSRGCSSRPYLGHMTSPEMGCGVGGEFY